MTKKKKIMWCGYVFLHPLRVCQYSNECMDTLHYRLLLIQISNKKKIRIGKTKIIK